MTTPTRTSAGRDPDHVRGPPVVTHASLDLLVAAPARAQLEPLDAAALEGLLERLRADHRWPL